MIPLSIKLLLTSAATASAIVKKTKKYKICIAKNDSFSAYPHIKMLL